ncbi:MAG: YggS family pyridoxal phosphate-dependent enzyme [Rhodospirillales bacterium]|nr:YggS family pyridoxal phosphate-dependent enzyme [Rhodospirillales bacterium]
MVDVAANLASVRAEIAAAARTVRRAPETVTLVAVSKTHGPDTVRRAIDAGQRVFGENRVQEAESKWPDLKREVPDLRLHLIGPLQRNKVRRAVRLFDVIETLDSAELARAIVECGRQEERFPAVFVQVNTGEEPQKAGIFPEDTDALVRLCRDDLGLAVHGLMCIPPVDEEPSLHFALLREIAHRNGLSQLSMGMSGDFAIAVQFGATHVRIGTAIFGDRPAGFG